MMPARDAALFDVFRQFSMLLIRDTPPLCLPSADDMPDAVYAYAHAARRFRRYASRRYALPFSPIAAADYFRRHAATAAVFIFLMPSEFSIFTPMLDAFAFHAAAAAPRYAPPAAVRRFSSRH